MLRYYWNYSNNNQNAIVAKLDLSSDGDGNLIWHTRLASGYEYTDVKMELPKIKNEQTPKRIERDSW